MWLVRGVAGDGPEKSFSEHPMQSKVLGNEFKNYALQERRYPSAQQSVRQ